MLVHTVDFCYMYDYVYIEVFAAACKLHVDAKAAGYTAYVVYPRALSRAFSALLMQGFPAVAYGDPGELVCAIVAWTDSHVLPEDCVITYDG